MRIARLCRPYLSLQLPLGEGPTVRSSEQVWTGLKWWPPDIISMCGRAGGSAQVSFPGEGYRAGAWGGGGPQVSWPMGLEPGDRPCSEVQCIMGNGHMRAPSPVTDRHIWKHYLPTTWLAGGNNNVLGIVMENFLNWLVFTLFLDAGSRNRTWQ